MRITKKTFWVARNDDFGQDYVTSPHPHRLIRMETGAWDPSHGDLFCPDMFEAHSNIRLKPGEGPIRVRLELVEDAR